MARARSQKATRAARDQEGASARPWGEFLGVALLALSVLLIGGLLSFQAGDGLLMGPVGQLLATALYAVLGMAAYLLALGIAGLGLKALLGREVELEIGESLGFAAATLAGCVLLHISFPEYRLGGYTAGGLTGEIVGEICIGLFDVVGTYLVTVAILTVGLIASTPLSTRHLLHGGDLVLRGALATGNYLWGICLGCVDALRNPPAAEEEEEEVEEDEVEDELVEDEEEEEDEAEVIVPPKRKSRAKAKGKKARANRRRKREEAEEAEETEGEEAEETEEVDAEDAETDDAEVNADEDEEAAEDDAPGGAKKSKRRSKSKVKKAGKSAKKDEAKRAAPEIVIADPTPPKAEQCDDGGADAELDAEVDAITADEAPTDDAGAPKAGKAGKKAPPRPSELAKRGAGASDAGDAGESAPPERIKPIPGVVRTTPGPYKLPPVKLFETVGGEAVDVDKSFVLEQAEKIEEALAQFKIRGQVTKIHPGPVITRYEFKPEPGVKLSKIESLENDLAMALEAIRIRILAPIPGKATVGFEVPNKSREIVSIQEILESDYFAVDRKAKLPMALGKNITGRPVSIDLAKAPHLLVAGATGSGKSVGVNSMICSLLYACPPEDVRMIMIDPKMLELSIYKDIPHLLLPVITDPEQANLALRWAVDEMERRYAILSEAQVRDIGGFNRKLPQLIDEWEAEKRALEEAAAEASRAAAEEGEDAVLGSQLPGFMIDQHGNQTVLFAGEDGAKVGDKPEKLPYIVVIIDEFADLMMVASKEVEANVARIAAKARAAGIHLIVATQRPSVDVITGTIKNNFPSRIAFQVTSDIDSRTILDTKGAKQLLGMGDMLHMDRGGQPDRVHGCFVSENEILKVVDFIKKQARPVYNRSITAKRDDGNDEEMADRKVDPFYDKAVQIVAETQKVSTSMIQRRLNIGYNRAAKIVEMMEEDGVIGPSRGTTPREVLISAA
ncbi:MAG: DNA translocase FtsK 4TM domain-containing protein [Nannocystaceae bacterium]